MVLTLFGTGFTLTPGYFFTNGSIEYFLYCAAASADEPAVGRAYQRFSVPDTPDPEAVEDEGPEQAVSASAAATADAASATPLRERSAVRRRDAIFIV